MKTTSRWTLFGAALSLVGLTFAGARDAAAGPTVTASASASVNLKLIPEPGGMFFVAKPPAPIVRPHRITLGVPVAGVVRTRVFGLAPGGVVVVGARARSYVLVSSPAVVVGSPAVGVAAPGVVVGSPAVVVGAPGVVVGAPAVVVGVPAPVVVVAPSPVVVVPGKTKVIHPGKGHGRRH